MTSILGERRERRPTRVVPVGAVNIGSDNPVSIQSMITEETRNIGAAAYQVAKIHAAGADIVRITTPTLQDAIALGEIKARLKTIYQDVPIVADVHHRGFAIAMEAIKHADKVRFNPGLFDFEPKTDYTEHDIEAEIERIRSTFGPAAKSCRENGVAMRIGVNHGSLSKRINFMYGNTSEGMVQSALEYLHICEDVGNNNVVLSLKASDVGMMVSANRLMVRRMDELGMDYPLHLGVTEAGKGEDARIKSSMGIGALLLDGIGDTIRVSLTEDRVNEIDVCNRILQASRLRQTHCEIISCPGCGRTKFDISNVTDIITDAFTHLKLRIAVMGCIVNGPGEMADADYGYVGQGGGKIALYRKKEVVAIVPQSEGEEALKCLIRSDGKWEDPPIISNGGQLRVLNAR